MPNDLEEVGVCRRPGHYASWGSKDGKPHFPDKCSECGAALVSSDDNGATYTCGAEYKPKPQKQTHTHIWWGICPK